MNKYNAIVIICVALLFCVATVVVVFHISWGPGVLRSKPYLYPMGIKFTSGSPLEHEQYETKSSAVMINTVHNKHAGFGWLLYNVLKLAYYSEKTGSVPIVYLNGGLYQESRPKFTENLEFEYDLDNFFNNYFESLEPIMWRGYLKNLKPNTLQRPSRNKQGSIHAFDRRGLKLVASNDIDFNYLWKKYLIPRAHIKNRISNLTEDLFPDPETFIYAIHYRGTDKYSHSGKRDFFGKIVGVASEDRPVHCTYQWCLDLLKKRIETNVNLGNHGRGQYAIFLATDEAPFLDAAIDMFGELVKYQPNALRSNVSTSGNNIDTRLCGFGITDSPACRELQDLVDKSVHRGMKEESGYRKGEEVLVDMLMLAKARCFFKSKGNVSNCAVYAREHEDMEVVDMSDVWRSTNT